MRRAAGSRRGVALIIVMTVILALTLIATPFVISMLLQERIGTTARYESQAGYGAEGVRNYALSRLMYSIDHQERRFGTGPLASYHFDTAQELEVRMEDSHLRNKVKLQDPFGAGTGTPGGGHVWGIRAEDEQGKLNVRTAPRNAISRVEALIDPRVANRQDFLTQYSGRDASWIFPQRIRTINGTGNPLSTGAGPGVGFDNSFPYGIGARVRLSKPGLRPLVGTVNDNQGAYIVLDVNADTAYIDGMIELEARHPVNLNTARLETLVAVFQGLNRPGVQNAQVDGGAAAAVARAVVDRDFTRMEEFLLALGVLGGVNPQQRATIALNAVCPTAMPLEGSGTAGFCFKSYDVYTVEALASANNPAGAQVAGRGFREVVSVSPPAILTRFVESQLDFDLMLAAGAPLQSRRLAGGYPYGGRMNSFPNFIPTPPLPSTPTMAYAPSDIVLKPQQRGGPGGNEAYVQPAPADDFRGEGDYDRELVQQAGGRWSDNQARETFSDSQEGKRLQNASLTYPWNHVLTYLKNSGQVAAADLTAGGFDLWFKVDNLVVPVQSLFEIRENDWYNRMSLTLENNELILRVCDGTLGNPGGAGAAAIDNGCAEVRMPLPISNDAWQHVGAAWKGTRLGELALLADGKSHAQQKFRHANPESVELMTQLSSPLSDTATSWAVQNNGWMPPNLTVGIINHPVAYRIGNECILSDGGTLLRGARGTQAVQHPAGAKVTLWGYASRLTNQPVNVTMGQLNEQLPYDRLTMGGGQLQYLIGVDPQATVAGDKQDPNNPAIRYIDMTQTDIGVMAGNVTDFPDQGYLKIRNEVVHYTGRSTGGVGGQGNAKFTGCSRGQMGTTAAQHNTGSRVELWGFPVSSTANYLQKTVVQIDDEWFLVQKNLDTTKPNYWISFIDSSSGTPVPVSLSRGFQVLGSIPNSHSAGTQVIPTFVVQGQSMGPGDPVTMTDASNNKELHQVRRTPMQTQGQGGPSFNLGNRQIVGLVTNVVRDYAADGLFVRALKFPSGELLGLPWLMSSNPSVTVGPFDGLVDEVKFHATERTGLRVGREVTTSDVSIQLNADPTQAWGGYPTKGGLYKIGDEYIGWGNLTLNAVSMVKRGWLNSVAEVHDLGDPVFDLPWVPVASMAQDLSATERSIRLNQKLSGREQHRQGRAYTSGYVEIDNELIGFEWNNRDGLVLSMPPRMDGSTGLYRGAFGTAPAAHPMNNSLVYGIPYRYRDTYRVREFDNTMVWFQWSTKMDLAQWRNVKWTQEIPANDPNIIVHALVRVDGKGEFWEPAAFTETTLIKEFLQPAGRNEINKIGHLQDAGQLDIRFYFEYKSGSYDPLQPASAVSWKRAPKIKEIRVEYDRPTQTYYHEDY